MLVGGVGGGGEGEKRHTTRLKHTPDAAFGDLFECYVIVAAVL